MAEVIIIIYFLLFVIIYSIIIISYSAYYICEAIKPPKAEVKEQMETRHPHSNTLVFPTVFYVEMPGSNFYLL